MQNEILIREFDNPDIPEMANLMIELGYATTVIEMTERLKQILQDTNYRTLVAINKNEVIGMIGLIKNFFWERNGCYVKVQALVVKQSFRKKGVGKLLIESAEDWAKEIGATLIALNCGIKEERNDAHKFYPKVGFQHKSFGYNKEII